MSIEQGKYVFAAAPTGLSGAPGQAPTVIQGGGAAQIVLPGGDMLLRADFSRAGDDLLITAADGGQIIILDYFAGQVEADLMTEGGALLPFDLVSALAGPLAPGQYAQADEGVESAPIGRVSEAVGEVTATRVDGTTVTLSKDSPVFQGDILETGAGGAIAVVFIDETEFSLGEDGRMVLDEFIFDPTSLEGSSTFSVVQGVFVFVSGEIAASNPDGMIVRTPVATLGIRGTKVAGKAAAEGELNTVTLMPESGGVVTGSITVSTQSSTVTLNTAYQTTAISSVFDSPSSPITLSAAQAGGLYGAVSNLLPATAAAGPAGGDDAGGAPDDAGAAPAGAAEGAAGAEGEADAEGGEGAVEGDVAGEGTEGEGEGEELDVAVAVDAEGGPDDEGLAGPDGPAEGEVDVGPDALGPDVAGVDAPAPGQEGFTSADDAPSEEEIASAGFAAAGDAFDAFEDALNAGGSLEEAAEAAMVAGETALNTYLGAVGQDLFNQLMEFGPDAAFGDAEFFDGVTPPEGFDPAQFSDEFAGFEGDFGAFGDFGGEFGDLAQFSPEELDALADEFEEFGTDPLGIFGVDFGFDPVFGDPYIGGDFFGDPFFDAGFVGGDFFGDPFYDPFYDPFFDPFFFDDLFFDDTFFAEDDFFFLSDADFFGFEGVSNIIEFNSLTPGGATSLANTLVGGLAGLTLTSASFTGDTTVGSGSAGIFASLNLGSVGGNSFDLGGGIVLTSGDGTPNNTNTAIGFTGTASGTGDSDLDTLLSNTGHSQTTKDSSILEFTFTVPTGINAIVFDFMFGTDEFNEQSVNDVAAVFVDGTNFAFFQDGNILHFDNNINEGNFFNNTGGALGIEYDGLTPDDLIVGLLDTGLSTHTVKIAVSDTSDTVVDTALFLSGFKLTKEFSSTSNADDDLAGTTGADTVDGGLGNDFIFGAAGNDSLSGGDGNDELNGNLGDDTLSGNAGNDEINGGGGNDAITGGTGNDFMSGGAGADNFIFTSPSDGEINSVDGADIIGAGFHNIISDFTSGTDKISLSNGSTLFNLGGSLTAGTNFFTIAAQFNGTNSGASGTTPYIVVDSTKTVYYDDNGNNGTGYTVVTENSADAPVITDFALV